MEDKWTMDNLPPTAKNTLQKKVDVASTAITYVGQALSGSATSAASWQIQKISTSGTVTTIQFALGNCAFVHVWDDRATLTYQ